MGTQNSKQRLLLAQARTAEAARKLWEEELGIAHVHVSDGDVVMLMTLLQTGESFVVSDMTLEVR